MQRRHSFTATLVSIGVSILSAQSARSAEWWNVASDGGEYHFADRETIISIRIGDRQLTQMWVSLFKPGTEGVYRRSTDTLWLFDCFRRQAAVKAATSYNDDGDADSEEAEDAKLDFFSVAPQTLGSDYLGFACNSRLGEGEATTFSANGVEYAWVNEPLEAINQLHRRDKPSAGEERRPITAEPAVGSGTAFFVDPNGLALTSAHVVEGCANVSSQRWGQARVVAIDSSSDLTLLKFTARSAAFAHLRVSRPKLGEPVSVAGFPLTRLLGVGMRVTTGTVSGLSGPVGNRTYFQISAPVQPGNSGGPVVDSEGALIGVVAARLGEGETLAQSGGLPQNINFAVAGGIVGAFLEENGVVSEDTGPKAKATEYTFRIECRQG